MSAERDPHGPIEFLTDEEHPGGTMLLMDSVRQSYVDLDDPSYLDFEYVQFMASVLACLPDGPLATTHIGGGALTLARYLHVTRPGSPQIVLEPNTELTEQVRQRLPLPRGHRIRVRPVDGRTGIAQLRPSSADVLVLDAFADGRVPAELTTAEFFEQARQVLKPSGVLLANLVDEPGLAYLARVIASVRASFGELSLVASHNVLKGRRFGNVVLAAAAASDAGSSALDADQLRTALLRQPFPAAPWDSQQLRARFTTARPFTDADSDTSPDPIREGWRIR